MQKTQSPPPIIQLMMLLASQKGPNFIMTLPVSHALKEQLWILRFKTMAEIQAAKQVPQES